MQLVCFIIVFILWSKLADSMKIIWDNSVQVNLNKIDNLGRGEELALPNWFFIFPGTKWCGVGNIAENENDFGPERDTDKCCRNHDLCPDIIEAYQTKYNLTNPSFYTKLNCKCDLEFYKCLKSVNSKSATQVGQLYFTALGTQCFKNEFPVKCLQYTYFPHRKCVAYSVEENGIESYQWFDVPNF